MAHSLTSTPRPSKSMVFKPDEPVEDIPLDYPELVEDDVASWWYDGIVKERREENRRRWLEQQEVIDYHEWLEKAGDDVRVLEYLKNSSDDVVGG